MAKERKLISEERTDNVIRDSEGKESIRLSLIRREYEEDETEYDETTVESWEGGDGTVVKYEDLARPQSQGGITLQRCDECQLQSSRILFRRKTNQFSPASRMRSCFFCRSTLCSRHYYTYQNHIVCKSCRRKRFVLKKILTPIFFKRI